MSFGFNLKSPAVLAPNKRVILSKAFVKGICFQNKTVLLKKKQFKKLLFNAVNFINYLI